ncbi:RluA family pseudouridine synthase [Sulfurospirillum sp. 1612]|uniref:RluA family pseudouridine synthase n=1 Tax=Sulfurospirillum sp. 1612 TaxID=3094835 RepID=UPI002F956549
MGFVRKKFFVDEKIKAYQFLINTFHCTMRQAQKWIDKKRVFLNNEIMMTKSAEIAGMVEVIVFVPKPRGLLPVFETEDFAIFEKPSGVLIHPNGFSDEYSLNDEIKYLYGENANVAHRIDKETSGLVLVSKHKEAEVILKMMFEAREIQKEYVAIVEGKLEQNLIIDADLKSNLDSSPIRLKSFVVSSGHRAITHVFPYSYDAKTNRTLVKVRPLTGRTHQIRVHMFHVKHRIVGDPIYGVDDEFVEEYLCGTLDKNERRIHSGAERLMLHAHRLSFYYKEIEYNVSSKIKLGGFLYE